MEANEREHLNELVQRVVGAAYEVANELGAGFLEKVYERALVMELTRGGLQAEPQKPIPVSYKGERIGDYYADVLVDEKLIVELKCVEHFTNEHIAQCLNYLKATGFRIALLINLQHPRIEWKRIVYKY